MGGISPSALVILKLVLIWIPSPTAVIGGFFLAKVINISRDLYK